MIRAQIVLDRDDVVRKVTVFGHSDTASRGNNLICAAISMLIRTAVRTLEDHPSMEIRYSAPNEGTVDFEIIESGEGDRDWLKGVSDMVRTGLYDLVRESPGQVEVKEERR